VPGSTVLYHTSGNLISIGNGNGVKLSFGLDPVTWKTIDAPLLFAEGSEWTRSPSATELIAYPSFIPMSGNDEPVGNNFWMYYMYLQPGDYFTSRYLVRREVTFTMMNSTDTTPQAGVELSRYTNGTTTWTTTAPPLGAVFTYAASLGYILTIENNYTVPIYDCYITNSNDYILTVKETDCSVSGIQLLRHMGWVYQFQQPISVVATQPIYRCWNPKSLKHSVSNNINCEGNGTLEYILGWTMTN